MAKRKRHLVADGRPVKPGAPARGGGLTARRPMVFLAAALLFCGLVILPAKSAKADAIVFAAPEVAPFFVAGPNGEAAGPGVEMFLSVADALGLDVRAELLSVKRGFRKLRRGEADVMIAPHIPALEDAGLLKSQSIVVAGSLNVYWPAGGRPVTSLSDLTGLRVAAMTHGRDRSLALEGLIDTTGWTIAPLSDPVALLRFVARGRADVGIMVESVFRDAAAKLEAPGFTLEHAPLKRITGHFFVHPDALGDGAALLQDLELAHARLLAEGHPAVMRLLLDPQRPQSSRR